MVGNLLDGTNRTRDDTHMWLAPFTPGHSHLVRLKFSERATIAMIRIWVSLHVVVSASLYCPVLW